LTEEIFPISMSSSLWWWASSDLMSSFIESDTTSVQFPLKAWTGTSCITPTCLSFQTYPAWSLHAQLHGSSGGWISVWKPWDFGALLDSTTHSAYISHLWVCCTWPIQKILSQCWIISLAIQSVGNDGPRISFHHFQWGKNLDYML
jgi:hypothetical protein